jgi:hypothetical protein
MTLSLALALNAVADVALLGGLGWFMTRPAKLTPHVPARRLAVLRTERRYSDEDVRIAA